FRTETPFPKLVEKFIAPGGKFLDEDGKDHVHKLEILGAGQQLVVDSIHPETGRPYTWEGGTPWEVPATELPLLTKEQARAWLDDATALLVKRGWQHVNKSQTTDNDDDAGVLSLIVQLAIRLWGQPTDNSRGEYRFGGRGSKHVDALKRYWFDFEANEG